MTAAGRDDPRNNGTLLDPAGLLDILESNRRLTLRVIQAFPEDALFNYKPVEILRPFGEMVQEILNIEDDYIRGIALGEWSFGKVADNTRTKADLLAVCEQVRARTREVWPSITTERLLQVEPDPFFGGPPQSHFERLVYALENEIHHRGQGYVYLRELGIEPPLFYER
ncbi:damage-inducible protein DinB [Thermaerobacter sp. PB12/4term]|uniref:DinB family protein n=1 Tax=Thermaerobacter sp. PB12/4term TaxID=2293838 RepID=UPI000E32B5F5|nr:DinB family protein [Thermaerobacter sp. PB12/4term]QIA26654.1 damage-inducible protein DinB [Thermaerobacter sp. PB12/4term]